MARINIEDSLWADPRFQELMIKVGNRHTAKGMILELWTVSQKYWVTSKGLGIPKPAWIENGLPNELIECRMARDDGDFIYAIGAKEQFAWLNACSENGKKGGPAAAKSRSENIGKSKRQKTSKHVENRQDTSSSSSSFSSSESNSNSFSKEGEAASQNARAFIAAYCECFKGRYGSNPPIGGKGAGIAQRLVKDLGLARAKDLIDTYLLMHDPFFLTKRHDLVTFESNLNAVAVKHDTGKGMSQTQIRQADKMAGYQDQLQRIAEGTL